MISFRPCNCQGQGTPLTFSEELDQLARIARQKGYKKAWIFYRIKEKYGSKLSLAHLTEIAQFLGYKESWIYLTYLEILNPVDPTPSPPPQLIPHLKRLDLQWPVELAQIRTAYRRLSKRLHPDQGGSHESFIQLQRSYKVLMEVAA